MWQEKRNNQMLRLKRKRCPWVDISNVFRIILWHIFVKFYKYASVITNINKHEIVLKKKNLNIIYCPLPGKEDNKELFMEKETTKRCFHKKAAAHTVKKGIKKNWKKNKWHNSKWIIQKCIVLDYGPALTFSISDILWWACMKGSSWQIPGLETNPG